MTSPIKAVIRRFLPRRIAPRRILAGPLRGARIVTSWHDYPAAILGRTERQLLAWFAANTRPGETWLDIGAHYGYTAIALSRLVGAGGRVFAFEPLLATAGHLARTGTLNGLTQLAVVPVALGSVETLELQRSTVVRGMINPATQGGPPETMLAARLDWLWPRICGGDACIAGVKIDVQGMEIEVLRGMTGLLRERAPRLVVEVHPNVSRSRLIETLQSAGYGSPGVPIEPIDGEVDPKYVDDRSYFFSPDALVCGDSVSR
jgi:FkbM family methyltransferase